MRADTGYYANPNIERDVQVLLWKDERVETIVRGTNTSEPTDISGTVTRLQVDNTRVSATLEWSDQYLSCGVQPQYGDFLQVKTDGFTRMLAMVGAVNSITEARGTRMMTVDARTPETLAGWKDIRASTRTYSQGVALSGVTQDVLTKLLGLTSYEYNIPHTTYTIPHASTMLADMTPWEMLEQLYLPQLRTPFVNALSQISWHSKETIHREADLQVQSDRILSIDGSRSEQQMDRIVMEWKDPNLSKEFQEEQILGRAHLTAGFFKPKVTEDIWFSEDRTQRAEETRMEIVESCNSGLLPVAEEEWEEKDEYHGEIVLTNTYYAAGLATVSIAVIISNSQQPDTVTGTTGVSGGGTSPHPHTITAQPTTPTGRIQTVAAQAGLAIAMMSIGTGRYEIWGKPFDYVHAKNKTIAMAKGASPWMRNTKEISTDLIQSETHAQNVAVTELAYEAIKATSWGCTLTDDPRIEVGDIIELEDYGRIFVTGWSMDLTRDAPAEIKIKGFRT